MNKFILLLIIIPLKLHASEVATEGREIHVDRVDSICLMSGNIISASFDGLIKSSLNKTSIIIGSHNDWVRKLICHEEYLISASNDGYISVWEGSNKISSVKAHSWWVSDIASSNNKIVSVSLDETVKVWSFPELELLYSYKIFGSNKHYSVSVINDKAFISSTNGKISILDISNFKWVKKNKTITGIHSISLSVAKSDSAVFFGSSSGYITRINVTPPYKSRGIKISKFPIKSLAYYENFLYASDSNGYLFKINAKNIKNVLVLNHNIKSISALVINDNYIYAGYDDGFIRKLGKKHIEKNKR